MATIRTLMETAIRKVASNAIGRNSSTQGTVTIAVDSTSTDWQAYTPSADGFIFLNIQGSTNPAILHMKDYTNNPAIEVFSAESEARNIKTMRVWKGKTALFRAYSTHTSFTAQFFKSIGGGLRLLAETLGRGGAVWLRLRVYFKKLLEQGRKVLSGTTERQSKFRLQEQVGQTIRITIPLRMGSFRCFATSHQKHGSLPMGMTTTHGLEQETRSIVALFAYLFAKVKTLVCGVNSARKNRVKFQQYSFLSLDHLALQGGI